MAWLSLPIGRHKQGKTEFYQWVDAYLKADANQPYQYDGRDVYAARCAVLHQFGVVADFHRQKNPPKKFGYLDNGPHQTDGGDVVLISVAVLMHDFFRASTRFMADARNDADLRARIDSRVQEMLNISPI
jgi:hypothetical protein